MLTRPGVWNPQSRLCRYWGVEELTFSTCRITFLPCSTGIKCPENVTCPVREGLHSVILPLTAVGDLRPVAPWPGSQAPQPSFQLCVCRLPLSLFVKWWWEVGSNVPSGAVGIRLWGCLSLIYTLVAAVGSPYLPLQRAWGEGGGHLRESLPCNWEVGGGRMASLGCSSAGLGVQRLSPGHFRTQVSALGHRRVGGSLSAPSHPSSLQSIATSRLRRNTRGTHPRVCHGRR